MVRSLSIVLLSFVFIQNGFSETWISINNKVVQVTKHTNCKKLIGDNWNDVCDCCLVKKTRIREQSELTATQKCEKKYNCRFNESLDSDERSAKAALSRAEKNLKAMTIVDIEKLAHPPKLPEDGVLTPSHVNDIMHALNDEDYLHLPSTLFGTKDDGAERLRIKTLGDSAKGYFSGQLFTIRYDPYYVSDRVYERGQQFNTLYILKETKKGVGEIEHLYQTTVSELIREKVPVSEQFVEGQHKNSSVIAGIAFDELHFKLTTHGTVRYFSLLQTAPGMSLHRHLEEFGKKLQTVSKDSITYGSEVAVMKGIFRKIGVAMSKLHQRYAKPTPGSLLGKTYTHGDLHSENIFYDPITEKVTLIDNETFALSLDRPSCGVNDLVEFYMLHTVHTIAHAVSKQLTTNIEFGINDQLWHELWKELLTGYIEAYGDLSHEDYSELYKEIRREFFKGFNQLRIFKSPRYFRDQRKLKRFGPSLRRRHIKHHELRDAFDQLFAEGLQKYTT